MHIRSAFMVFILSAVRARLLLFLALFAAPVFAASGGRVVAWGDNSYGQTNAPAGLSGVIAISAGWAHSLALINDGTLVAWGANEWGQLNIPTGLNGVSSIACGHSHNLALKTNGTVVAWGLNRDGECNVPVGLTGVKAIAAGGQVSMALQTNGTVVLWGNSAYGGSGSSTGVAAMAVGSINTRPVYVHTNSGEIAIAEGWSRVVSLNSDGTVSDSGSGTPAALTGVTAISVGISDDHVVALKSDGTVVTWGGSPSFPAVSNIPIGLHGVTAIAAGGVFSLALVTDNPFSLGAISFYAGTTLSGQIGQQFRVDYADMVSAGTTNWQLLTNITLSTSPLLVIDPNSPGRPQRFYRATPVP